MHDLSLFSKVPSLLLISLFVTNYITNLLWVLLSWLASIFQWWSTSFYSFVSHFVSVHRSCSLGSLLPVLHVLSGLLVDFVHKKAFFHCSVIVEYRSTLIWLVYCRFLQSWVAHELKNQFPSLLIYVTSLYLLCGLGWSELHSIKWSPPTEMAHIDVVREFLDSSSSLHCLFVLEQVFFCLEQASYFIHVPSMAFLLRPCLLLQLKARNASSTSAMQSSSVIHFSPVFHFYLFILLAGDVEVKSRSDHNS